MEQSAHNSEIDNLLVKWLAGEASFQETDQLQKWVDASPENAQLKHDFSKIWEQHSLVPMEYVPDAEEAWSRFLDRVRPVQPIQNKRTNFRWQRYWTIAATLLLTFSIGLIAYLATKTDVQARTLSAMDRVLRDTLPDGSVVTLNKRSSLAYESDPGKANTRKVTLDGEAFFDVKPDPSRPFQIAINDVTITVLGTSFHVNGKGKTTEVVVETGLVRVENRKYLTNVRPGYRLKTKPVSEQLTVALNRDLTYQYLRTGKLICQNMPLSDLISRLEEIFETKIDLQLNHPENLRITTTFATSDLKEILSVIGETFDAKVEQNQNGYAISNYEKYSEK